jgi:hypothetical protein
MKENKFLTNKWLEIKKMFEANTNGSKEYGSNFEIDGELDELTQHFLGYITKLTLSKGFDAEVEGVKLDLWKERIWSLIENAGLLPNIAWKDERDADEEVEVQDNWYSTDSEFDADMEAQSYEVFDLNKI